MQDNNFMSDTDLKSMFTQIGKAKEEKARKINNEIDRKAEENRKRRQGLYIEGIDFEESSTDALDERSRQIALEIERIKKGEKSVRVEDESNEGISPKENEELKEEKLSAENIVHQKTDAVSAKCVIEFLGPVFEGEKDTIADFSETISFSYKEKSEIKPESSQDKPDSNKELPETTAAELFSQIDNILNQ